MHRECTSNAQAMHKQCTSNAQAVQLECTSNAPAMHLQCTFSAQAMHLQCTCNAPVVHMQCTCSAPAMQLKCSGIANDPEFAFEKPDNFPFWDKDSQKKKKKIATSRDAFGCARHLKMLLLHGLLGSI